jgi:hypothetical protein
MMVRLLAGACPVRSILPEGAVTKREGWILRLA